MQTSPESKKPDGRKFAPLPKGKGTSKPSTAETPHVNPFSSVNASGSSTPAFGSQQSSTAETPKSNPFATLLTQGSSTPAFGSQSPSTINMGGSIFASKPVGEHAAPSSNTESSSAPSGMSGHITTTPAPAPAPTNPQSTVTPSTGLFGSVEKPKEDGNFATVTPSSSETPKPTSQPPFGSLFGLNRLNNTSKSESDKSTSQSETPKPASQQSFAGLFAQKPTESANDHPQQKPSGNIFGGSQSSATPFQPSSNGIFGAPSSSTGSASQATPASSGFFPTFGVGRTPNSESKDRPETHQESPNKAKQDNQITAPRFFGTSTPSHSTPEGTASGPFSATRPVSTGSQGQPVASLSPLPSANTSLKTRKPASDHIEAPSSFTDDMKASFATGYHLRSLNASFQRRIANLDPNTQDYDMTIRFYLQQRQHIGSPFEFDGTLVPAVARSKRKASDDTSDERGQADNKRAKTAPSGLGPSTSGPAGSNQTPAFAPSTPQTAPPSSASMRIPMSGQPPTSSNTITSPLKNNKRGTSERDEDGEEQNRKRQDSNKERSQTSNLFAGLLQQTRTPVVEV